jgi:outer membrane lipoprotein-sorting protein
MKKSLLFSILLSFLSSFLLAQEPVALIKQVKAKIDLVNDYQAVGKVKTDVLFLKIPVATVNVWFKKPNKFKITKEKGIAILPKGGVSINMANVMEEGKFIAVDAGRGDVNGTDCRILKLLPTDENADVVVNTVYIDDKKMLLRKAQTTTKENGTYELTLTYGKFEEYALPDKVVISFNTKDYKLPKGVTLEYDDGVKPDAAQLKKKKGTVEIAYKSYIINQGVSDDVFKAK